MDPEAHGFSEDQAGPDAMFSLRASNSQTCCLTLISTESVSSPGGPEACSRYDGSRALEAFDFSDYGIKRSL